jgi:type I restriction enzyme S subunit
MSQPWPRVRLGEVVRHRKEFVTIDDATTYKRPRVQLHAQGIVVRGEVAGAFIKTKKQQVCRGGEFLVAEIDAKVGGFGIVPEALDGSIVSSHYFLFSLDEARLDRAFLDYFVRTPAFRDQVEAQGSTNYAAIRPTHVLGYEVPLPPLEEQQRVVARIEELAAQVHEAHTLRRLQEQEIQQMLCGAFFRVAESAPKRPMGEVAPLVRRPVKVDPSDIYPELGIRSFGKGTFHKPALSGMEIGSKRIFRIEPGDLLFSNVFAWEGAIAVARPEDANRVGSHRYITCVPRPGVAIAHFLCFFFLTNEGLELIRAASPGGAGRNRTLGLAALETIEVPVPAIEDQQWFDLLQSEVAALKLLQAETGAELDALLPAVLDRAFKGEV